MTDPDRNSLRPFTDLARSLGMRRTAPHYWLSKGWLKAVRVQTPQGFYYVATLADAQAARERANESRHAPRPRKKTLTETDE